MLYKPCLLIPCYNHGRQIRATLAALAQYDLPCLLVDDGSDVDTAAELDRLSLELPGLTLLRLARNGGKGAAVAHGIQAAVQLGFTHALQVDADGQHDPASVPALLAASRDSPLALISGHPQYDASIPKSRLYGRTITHFWVWVETLSLDIKDSMCGLRVYPLAATQHLLQRARLGRRMDFDIEVMVRLHWAGTPILFVPTRVFYPSDGISHFALLRDNLLISWMHTRLVTGMLLRLPRLLWRRGSAGHWSEQRESGAYWGLWVSLQCYRLLGPRLLRVLVYGIVAYFFLANRTARHSSQDFLRRVFAAGVLNRAPNTLLVYRHFLTFGHSLVDRLSSWTGAMRSADVAFAQRPLLMAQAQTGRGAVLLSSHLGNVEMCRALVDKVPGIKINVLMFTGNAVQINRLMREANPRVSLELIEVSEVNPATAMLLQDKIDRGELVVIAADRTSPGTPERVCPANFFGRPALFPQGPFILAALLRCPVYLLFCLREPAGYRMHLEAFADPLLLPRKQREVELSLWVQRFADRLEHYARAAPLQWFNFYDFWCLPAAAVEAASTDATPKRKEGL